MMRRSRSGILFTCAIAALASFGTTSASARKPAAGGTAIDRRQAFMKIQREMQQIGAKLAGIQKAAMKGNRKLKAQRDKLQAMIEAEMKKQGHDWKKGAKRYNQLRAKLQSGKLSGAQKQKAIAEMRQLNRSLQIAQMKAMRGKRILKATKSFQRKLEAAMIKKDPAAKKLIQQMHELRAKAEKIMQPRG